jgi:hypothetical protein
MKDLGGVRLAATVAFGIGLSLVATTLAAQTEEFHTVKEEHAVYVWKSPTGRQSASQQWRIQGLVGSTAPGLRDLFSDLFSFDVRAREMMVAMYGQDDAEFYARRYDPPAEGFPIWHLVPETSKDFCKIELGTFSGVPGLPLPFSFPALTKKDGSSIRLWGIALESGLAYMSPVIYVSKDKSTLMFGGEIGGVTTTASGINPSSKSLASVSAIVFGTIRYPDDKWTHVGGGYTIRSGGLEFDDIGVSLLVGTQYKKNNGSDAVADPLRLPGPQGSSPNMVREWSVTEIALSSNSDSARKALDRAATVTMPRLSKRQNLAAVIYIDHPTAGTLGKPDVLVEWCFYRQEGTSRTFFNRTNPEVLDAQTVPAGFDPAMHRLIAAQEVPLASFQPGDYLLEVTVSDRLSGKAVTREAPFVVVR